MVLQSVIVFFAAAARVRTPGIPQMQSTYFNSAGEKQGAVGAWRASERSAPPAIVAARKEYIQLKTFINTTLTCLVFIDGQPLSSFREH